MKSSKIKMVKNKIPSCLKVFLGIFVISFFHVFALSFPYTNFFINLLLEMLFWASIYIFMDWREWTK